MSLTSQFGFTNNTASTTKTLSLVDMKEVEKYGPVLDEPELYGGTNISGEGSVTTELLYYRGKPINQVNTNLKMSAPQSTIPGVMYGVRLEDVVVTTDSNDATYRREDPVVVDISIRHPRAAVITSDLVQTSITRAVSALKKEDNTWRIKELMQSALKPTTD